MSSAASEETIGLPKKIITKYIESPESGVRRPFRAVTLAGNGKWIKEDDDCVIIHDCKIDGPYFGSTRYPIPVEQRRYDEEGDEIICIWQKPEKQRREEEIQKWKLQMQRKQKK